MHHNLCLVKAVLPLELVEGKACIETSDQGLSPIQWHEDVRTTE